MSISMASSLQVDQVCMVVRDIRKTMENYWNLLGWGPWSVFEYGPPLLHDTYVRGERVDFTMIGAETHVGSMNIELIQPVSGPSIYQEFLDTFGEGLQHIGCMMHDLESSQSLRDEFAKEGITPLMGGRIGETIEFYYLDTNPRLKFCLESGSGHAIDLKPTYTYP